MVRVNIALFGVAAFLIGAALNANPSPAGSAEPAKSGASNDNMPDVQMGNGYTLGGSKDCGGLWASRDQRGPFAAVYSQDWRGPAAVLSVSRNQKGDGHDFAVVATKDEVYFQIRDEKGKFHFVPVQALLKLEEKKE